MERRPRLVAEPLDVDGSRPRRPTWTRVAARTGLVVEHRLTGVTGAIVALDHAAVTLRDRDGRDHVVRLADGAFSIDGQTCSLFVAPVPTAGADARVTASGSVAVADAPARVARASRILVEGVHDAELIEKVWGDDLRVEGVVVERMDGMDDLAPLVRAFGPRPGRRLGILLDHLVDGSKEQRAAAAIDHPDVLVCGHPWVDVWQAVQPSVLGIDAWPDVPRGEEWKQGICRRLGLGNPRDAWRQILASVTTYRDLEPGLVGAVEQLIDFVTEPTG
jgi:Protein of unknown function (DUF3097)